jgi:predicted transcriptional regulator
MLTDTEIKEKLIATISNTDNMDLLRELLMITEMEDEISGVYQLSAEEIVAVNEGIEQIENGQYLTHEESNKRADEWLKKFDGR